MDDTLPLALTVRITLGSPEETTRLARWLDSRLGPGDTILLEGQIGAGKSHFCRGLIQARLAVLGRAEEMPSPTFTLVQVYDAGPVELWHADLYRLTSADEVMELGLEDAFDSAICLVEWPDRLGGARPGGALTLRLSPGAAETVRVAEFAARASRWTPILAALSAGTWQAND